MYIFSVGKHNCSPVSLDHLNVFDLTDYTFNEILLNTRTQEQYTYNVLQKYFVRSFLGMVDLTKDERIYLEKFSGVLLKKI